MGRSDISGWIKTAGQRCVAGFRDLVLPARCMQCGRYIGPGVCRETLDACFCSQCLTLPLPWFSPPYCPCCGHLFARSDQENHRCETCLKVRPAISKVRAAFAYEGNIRTAVAQLKYQGRLRLATPLGKYLYESFERHYLTSGIDLILPIPLHPARAWHRGFNQSVLLARHFSRLYYRRYGRHPDWQVCPELLLRKRATESQTGLDGKLREKNLSGAFGLTSKADIKDMHLLLIDDVYTSGATCRAAADSLLKAGAGQVDVLVLARA